MWSVGSYISQKLYENTVGYLWGEAEDELGDQDGSNVNVVDQYFDQNGKLKLSIDAEYINLNYLDRVISNVQRWFDEKKEFFSESNGIIEEVVFRKHLRKALLTLEFTNVEENIELMLARMK